VIFCDEVCIRVTFCVSPCVGVYLGVTECKRAVDSASWGLYWGIFDLGQDRPAAGFMCYIEIPFPPVLPP